MKLGGLLNPKKMLKTQVRGIFDPAGATANVLSGGKLSGNPVKDAFRTMPGGSSINDAAGGLFSGPRNQDEQMVTNLPVDEGYYEDDEGYGSLIDPFDVEDFYSQQDPGYAFELQQGRQELLNSAAAGSGALSGAALKDLLGYSQNFARTGYNDAFNRHQVQTGNIFSRLSDIARLGQSAAAGVGSAGTQLAGNAGQMISNAGGASGAGLVGGGNALGQGATNYWLFKNPQLWGGGG